MPAPTLFNPKKDLAWYSQKDFVPRDRAIEGPRYRVAAEMGHGFNQCT